MKNLKKLASAVVILTLVASATGCDAVKKLGKKSSIDNDMVMDAAEDFSEALIALDAKKIEDGAFELKDTTKTLIEEYAFGPESEDVYKEWLKTFTYELSEDDIEIKEDEASIPVTFEYVDIESISTETSTADEWIAAIKDSKKTKELSVDFDFVYDEDEEDIFVDNADKVVKKFYDVVNTYIYVNSFVYYEDALTVSFAESEYEATDTLSVKIKCADVDALEDKDLSVKLSDPSYSTIYEFTAVFHAGAELTLDIAPKDCKLDAFATGYYTVSVDNADSTLYESASTYVEAAATPTPTPTEEPDETKDTDETDETSESDETKTTDETDETDETKTSSSAGQLTMKKPDDKVKGSYDDSKFVYTNEYFNIQFSVPEDCVNIDPSLLGDSAGNEFTIDFLGTSSTSTLVMVMLTQFADLGDTSVEDAIAFLATMDGEAAGKVEKKTVGEVEMYSFSNEEGVNNYVAFKDDCMLVIAFQAISGDADTSFIDDVTKTVKAVK